MLGELEDIDLEFESQRATPIESVRNNKTEHLNRYFCWLVTYHEYWAHRSRQMKIHWQTSEYHQPGPWSWLKYTSNFQVPWTLGACPLSLQTLHCQASVGAVNWKPSWYGSTIQYLTALDSSWQISPLAIVTWNPCWVSLSVLVLVIVNMYSMNPTSLQVSRQIYLENKEFFRRVSQRPSTWRLVAHCALNPWCAQRTASTCSNSCTMVYKKKTMHNAQQSFNDNSGFSFTRLWNYSRTLNKKGITEPFSLNLDPISSHSLRRITITRWF